MRTGRLVGSVLSVDVLLQGDLLQVQWTLVHSELEDGLEGTSSLWRRIFFNGLVEKLGVSRTRSWE